jgi:hypothetical protein
MARDRRSPVGAKTVTRDLKRKGALAKCCAAASAGAAHPLTQTTCFNV